MAEMVSKAKMIAKKMRVLTKKDKVAEVAKATTVSREPVKKLAKAETPPKTNSEAKPREAAAWKVSDGEMGRPAAVSEEMIEHLAYRFWVQRGFQDGDALQNWLRAEQELRGRVS